MHLHQTVILVHKMFKGILITGGIIITIILIVNIVRIASKILYPPPPEFPTVAFGKLSPIAFPDASVKDSFTYSLNTLSGKLPTLPDKVQVYKINKPSVMLLNVDNARGKVAEIGFVNDPKKQYHELALTPTKFQWQIVTSDLFRTIIMDTNTYNFKLTTSYRTYQPLLTQTFLSDETSAKDVAKSFLQNMSLYTDDIDEVKTKAQSLMLKDGVLVPADNSSDTQIMRVDLYQKDIDKLPIYYPTYPFSLLYFLIMARASNTDDVLEANFYHQTVATESATYPIKTAQEAYDDLAAGKAFVSNYFGTDQSISITDISLGYYLGETDQKYVMPVIVFQNTQNKDNFFAFVSAIKDTCLTNNSASIDDCQGKPVKK
jgi:hypothetical protein